MYRMVSEYGNELRVVSTVMERDSLIEKGWHEEKVAPEKPVEISKQKEVKTSGKTNRTKKNI